jgi:3-methyladenine DNA glycosylase/8-oxoguanine DNA glycosylase
MRQAMRLRDQIAGGPAFPGPAALLEMDDLQVPPVKAQRLLAIAEAALRGERAAERWRPWRSWAAFALRSGVRL